MKELPDYEPDRLMSIAELAELYGKTKRTIQRWCRDGRFPHWQTVGNTFAIPWRDVLADLDQQEEEN